MIAAVIAASSASVAPANIALSAAQPTGVALLAPRPGLAREARTPPACSIPI
jgi:hypothetical protein